ncbi:polysaccharide deacetylase family protein [Desulfovibrio sp. OttesenSCG-928-A18]|nr:polysaccharide deacetylase family protein [Desulfovibrio sp. OttesenSCG-928-A18]
MFFSLPVLMYHSICKFKHRLCISPDLFEDQCRVLAANGWRGIRLSEAEDYFLRKGKLPKKTLLFTFDDGYLDSYVHAEPILRRYGHHGALFPVLDLVERDGPLRPTREDLGTNPDAAPLIAELDKRPTVFRSRQSVSEIRFCNWNEIRQMHKHGHMASAPHSLRHDRVIRSLEFKHLYTPGQQRGFFSPPPHAVLWGFPQFNLGHFLSDRAYVPVPELFELVKKMVPQENKEALAFLRKPVNMQALLKAIRALPVLGVLESEQQYRARIFKEFTQCRERFEGELGEAPLSFCWPWGDYSSMAREEAKRAGFRLFFTTMRGANVRARAGQVRRMSVRNGTGEELLQRLRVHSNSLYSEAIFWHNAIYARAWKKREGKKFLFRTFPFLSHK